LRETLRCVSKIAPLHGYTGTNSVTIANKGRCESGTSATKR
jgi:hypothetical protein